MAQRKVITIAFFILLIVLVVYLVWWQQTVAARYARRASTFQLETRQHRATAEAAQTIIVNEVKARSTALSAAYSWATSQAETVIERDQAERLYATASAELVAAATFQAKVKEQQKIQARAYEVAIGHNFEQDIEITELNKRLAEVGRDCSRP